MSNPSTVVPFAADISELSGQVIASWFIANPNGPTAHAVGFIEIENGRTIFYKWMHFTGGRTWLVHRLQGEVEYFSGDYGSILANTLILLHNNLVLMEKEKDLFNVIPSLILTNENPAVKAALAEFVKLSTQDQDWGRELYYLDKYESEFFERLEEEYREIYELLAVDPDSIPYALKWLWAQHQHRWGFRNWQPSMFRSSKLTERKFGRWLRKVSDSDFHRRGLYQFFQMWVGACAEAEKNGLMAKLMASERFESLQETLNFFENFNLPLAPDFVTESYVRENMGY